MTAVTFRRFREGPDGIEVPVTGYLLCAPLIRREESTPARVVVPAPFPVLLVGGVATATLQQTSADWCWVIREAFQHGVTLYKAVGAAATASDTELVDVDPATLDPSADPEAAWWLALEALDVSDAVADYLSENPPDGLPAGGVDGVTRWNYVPTPAGSNGNWTATSDGPTWSSWPLSRATPATPATPDPPARPPSPPTPGTRPRSGPMT